MSKTSELISTIGEINKLLESNGHFYGGVLEEIVIKLTELDDIRKNAANEYFKLSQEIQGDEYKKDSFEFLKNATDKELDDFIE